MSDLESETFTDFVVRRFGGRFYPGAHTPDGKACALEAYSQFLGHAWTDDPDTLRVPDVRRFNDGLLATSDDSTGDTARLCALVEALVPVWTDPRRRTAWVQAMTLRTIRELLPVALRANGLPRKADRCAAASTLPEAKRAAQAAAAPADDAEQAAAYAAEEAARGAVAIILAAGASAVAHLPLLRQAVILWTDEARRSGSRDDKESNNERLR